MKLKLNHFSWEFKEGEGRGSYKSVLMTDKFLGTVL